jgi:DNA-binding response OmpR family regulator
MSATQAVAVLYVEDQPFIRDLVALDFEDAGFEVLTVADGTAALDALKGNVVPFRALITDVNLGDKLDGREIARRARELNRALPVMYVSGASGHEWKARGVPDSIMIVKLFTPAQLLGAITSLLKKASTARPGF